MQKGFAPILILVGILVLVAITGGAYYLGTQNNLSLRGSKGPVAISTPSTSPTPSPSNETANWKIYTNNEGSYSFMYPQNFQVSIRDNYHYSFFTGKVVKEIVINKSRDDLSNWFEISISVDDNPQNLPVNDVINNYLQKLKTISKTEDEISSAKIVTEKITKSLKPYKNGQIEGLHALFGYEYDYDIIVQARNNKIYSFQYTGDNGGKVSPQAEQLVNKILSTFKFFQ